SASFQDECRTLEIGYPVTHQQPLVEVVSLPQQEILRFRQLEQLIWVVPVTRPTRIAQAYEWSNSEQMEIAKAMRLILSMTAQHWFPPTEDLTVEQRCALLQALSHATRYFLGLPRKFSVYSELGGIQIAVD